MSVLSITETTPAAASTVVGGSLSGLSRYESLRIDAVLVGATGGALDVYLQRKVGPNLWVDWAHFAQLAAGAAAIIESLVCTPQNSTTVATTVTGGTDATPALTIAADSFLGGHPGDVIRAVYVAGASTSAGAAITIHVTGLGSKG
jgi:hypothetical protein